MKLIKICQKCNKNKASEIHHRFSQKKLYRKIYGDLIDAKFNIQYLCYDCHHNKSLDKFSELEFRQEAEKQGYNLPTMSKSLQFKTM